MAFGWLGKTAMSYMKWKVFATKVHTINKFSVFNVTHWTSLRCIICIVWHFGTLAVCYNWPCEHTTSHKSIKTSTVSKCILVHSCRLIWFFFDNRSRLCDITTSWRLCYWFIGNCTTDITMASVGHSTATVNSQTCVNQCFRIFRLLFWSSLFLGQVTTAFVLQNEVHIMGMLALLPQCTPAMILQQNKWHN